jgi:hypothetical protein
MWLFEQVEQQWLFFLFLCSCVSGELTQLLVLMDWLGFTVEAFMWSSSSLVDNKACQLVGDSLAVCVCCVACTHSGLLLGMHNGCVSILCACWLSHVQ